MRRKFVLTLARAKILNRYVLELFRTCCVTLAKMFNVLYDKPWWLCLKLVSCNLYAMLASTYGNDVCVNILPYFLYTFYVHKQTYHHQECINSFLRSASTQFLDKNLSDPVHWNSSNLHMEASWRSNWRLLYVSEFCERLHQNASI